MVENMRKNIDRIVYLLDFNFTSREFFSGRIHHFASFLPSYCVPRLVFIDCINNNYVLSDNIYKNCIFIRNRINYILTADPAAYNISDFLVTTRGETVMLETAFTELSELISVLPLHKLIKLLYYKKFARTILDLCFK